MRIGVKTGPLGWTVAELDGAWTVAEECGFNLISCFDHPSRSAWEPVTLLQAMADATSRIRLGIHVMNVNLCNPFLLAAQVATVQALSADAWN
jgi:alkanesulfonate monooxygenase SsuD/methylene tetrahydromethanopterin reductase-like flavin-dependent oxidoreductase (luciferase family)